MNLTGMPQADPVNTVITNNGFYPDLGVAKFINDYGIATDYSNSDSMLTTHVGLAIVDINRQLKDFKALTWSEESELKNVESDAIAGVSQLVTLYQHAVFSLAKSKMLISRLGETHRDQRAAQQMQASDNQEYWLSQSHDAVRQIVGVRSSGVELL
jgi:hypothetical protein